MTTSAAADPLPGRADRGDGADPAAETDAIVVRLGAGRFAVALAAVAEVGRTPAMTRVPGMPDWLAGVANWRGRILPVLDLRGLLGGDRTTPGPTARLLVLADDGVSVGLVVDGVDGTAGVAADVAPFPAALPGAGAGLLSGQVPRDDGPVAVLDVSAVMRLRDRLPRGRRSA